ncbi:hypothetical protein BDV95DRAFT_497315 [Massariosphaeria phaeospora]|uniref:Uncharacterized protein n=1 Tax=Massariosphaeria phaeospora TaxID=100035 RepID=A0A7C8I8F4_9PLEO|nr:hypothetical protein BDV95DRAFT_497315 [Massariosphaeria phaeospora]
MPTTTSLVSATFPSELLLQTIQSLPFGDGKPIQQLSLVHPRLRSLIATYQCSVTKSFIKRELPHATTDFAYDAATFGYAWLKQCIRQYDTVDAIMAVLMSKANCFAVESHNMGLVNTGLLMLYRVVSLEKHAARVTYINSLPRDPLTAMFLAMHYSILAARYHGAGIIHQRTYGRAMDAHQLAVRDNIEFCFAEAALSIGPGFVSDVLTHVDAADRTLLLLYHDHAHGIHDHDRGRDGLPGEFVAPVTQGPEWDPTTRETPLFATLLARLAVLSRCAVEDVRDRVVGDSEDEEHELAWLGLAGKEKLVQGRDLAGM